MPARATHFDSPSAGGTLLAKNDEQIYAFGDREERDAADAAEPPDRPITELFTGTPRRIATSSARSGATPGFPVEFIIVTSENSTG